MRPFTFTMNKHLLPIVNKPLLLHCISNLTKAGITDIGIVTGPLSEEVREKVGDGSAVGANVTYIYQGEPRGLAHAVLMAKGFLGQEPFLLHLGDNVLENGVESFARTFEDESCDCLVGVVRVGNPERYGIVEVVDGVPVAFHEKPSNPRSNLAVIGIYVFSPIVFRTLETLTPSLRGELEITDLIEKLRRTGRTIKLHHFSGWWKDAGTPSDLLEANALMLKQCRRRLNGTIKGEVEISGEVMVESGTVLETGTKIVGPVVIAEGCRIGPNARIGPNVCIDRHSVVSGATVRDSIIMENCEINATVSLRSSILGRNTVISGTPSSLSAFLGENTNLGLDRAS